MSRQPNNLNSLPKQERAAWFAGGRPSVGRITQVKEKTLVVHWVGKVRGTIISDGTDMYLFETQEQALEKAREFLANAKRIASGDFRSGTL